MIKKITLYICLFLVVGMSFGQYSSIEDQYNGFTARNFMKYNSFFTVPTFSVLHRDNQTIEAITRSSNIDFEGNPKLHILSYSGKMKSNKGAGIAVYQQEIGVFKDFGAIANYAHKIDMSGRSSLAIGFNLVYSRRGVNSENIIATDDETGLLESFDDIPVVNLQPAVTYSYSDFEIGVFFENLVDYNMKSNEMVTEFSEKTITAHIGYSKELENMNGLLEDTNFRLYGIGRNSQENGFIYGGNLLVDLPKAGWIKAGYDSYYGFNAGVGVNISERLSVGFSYEKNDNLGDTNEVGLLYTLGKSKRNYPSTKPTIKVTIPDDNEVISRGASRVEDTEEETEDSEYENPKYNDLSDEVERAQDSINALNKKINEIYELLKNQPKPTTQIIREVRTETNTVTNNNELPEELDTSLRRSTKTSWREEEVTKSSGGAGSMYYVALDQFKSLAKAKALVETYKKRKIKVKYVRDPKTKAYYVYEERYAKKEEAERVQKEINTGGGIDEGADSGMQITAKKKYKDPVYLVKITFGSSGETYKVRKTQPRARVRTMDDLPGVEPGYYMVVNVFSKKAYAHKFVDELRVDGINANYFINPNTGYRHVYIYKTDTSEDLIQNYNSNLRGRYYDRKNLIHIR